MFLVFIMGVKRKSYLKASGHLLLNYQEGECQLHKNLGSCDKALIIFMPSEARILFAKQ